MRKIIFRGKMPSGAWVYGDLRKYPNGLMFIESNALVGMTEVFADTVGRYTGINDKTGCHIYEGDILRAVLPATAYLTEYVWPLMSVSFHAGAFGVWQSQRDFTPLWAFVPRVEFEIVGNIHDNPDMIGGA